MKERVRKARVAMGWVWSYGERKFKGDVRNIERGSILRGRDMGL